MSSNTLIEWAHHTHCPWWGCVHVSPACDNCYAEDLSPFLLPPGWFIVGEGLATPRLSKRKDPNRPKIWGADAPRLFPPLDAPVSTAPFKWNRAAAALGARHRVFVSSMCDIFERHRLREVNVMMDERRERFFCEVVPACPSLDFLLLTKRPHDILRLVPHSWITSWPGNVWAGCTVEDPQRAAQRLPHLLEVPAPVRFISAEPLLGQLDLTPWLPGLDGVIAGGESGSSARPSDVGWVRSLRDQVNAAGKAFFFKQWGNWAPRDPGGNQLIKLQRKDSRLLDGRTWDDLPQPRGPVAPAIPAKKRR